MEEGEWLALPEGGWVWRLILQSPGAPHQVALFSDIRIPLHGELFIYAPAWTKGFRECADYCYRYGTFEVPHIHKLTTPSMPGEEIWLEYYQPHSPDRDGEEGLPTLMVASVMQGLPDNDDEGELGGATPEGSWPAARRLMQVAASTASQKVQVYTQFSKEVPDLQQKNDRTGRCTQSVLCDPRFDREKQAVMSIYAINMDKSNPQAYGTIGLCTGTLLSAPSGAFYLITADHCFTDKKAIDNFQYWMLIFNYQVPCGGKSAPPFRQLIQSVKLLFYDSDSDVLLLQLPAASQWTSSPTSWAGTPARVCTNRCHCNSPPAGSVKRISYTNGTNAISTKFPPPAIPGRRNSPNAGHALQDPVVGGLDGGRLLRVPTHRRQDTQRRRSPVWRFCVLCYSPGR
eukprot:jgi/Botrbrau1/6753/Bobra.0324s0038.1